jgi:hypothetical protein
MQAGTWRSQRGHAIAAAQSPARVAFPLQLGLCPCASGARSAVGPIAARCPGRWSRLLRGAARSKSGLGEMRRPVEPPPALGRHFRRCLPLCRFVLRCLCRLVEATAHYCPSCPITRRCRQERVHDHHYQRCHYQRPTTPRAHLHPRPILRTICVRPACAVSTPESRCRPLHRSAHSQPPASLARAPPT